MTERVRVLMRENEEMGNSFVITRNTPQFGDVRTAQEETLKKTISETVTLKEDALRYYPERNDMTLDGEVNGLNLRFQFRYNDPSGMGCYLWANAFQLNQETLRTVGKMMDAFLNWKESVTRDGDLMDKLSTYVKENG